MNRREFFRRASLLCAPGLLGGLPHDAWATLVDLPRYRVRRLTSPPMHHFFGYYGMPPWNASGARMVCLESAFHHRLPEAQEAAGVMCADPETGRLTRVGETHAWNLQQGALLHWNPLRPETEVIFNDRDGGELKAAVLDVETGRKRFLPRQISGVGTTGRHALSLSYGRVGRLRKVVGYAGAEDPNPNDPHPDSDGVFVMDLATGETKLVVSIGEVFRRSVAAYPVLHDRHMWFNHTVLNDGGTRFLFLARSWTPDSQLDSAMFTAGLDGSGLRQVTPWGSGVSHFDWRNDQEIIATLRLPGEPEMKHVLFPDAPDPAYAGVGEGYLLGDGHCTFSPDGRWLATDRKHPDSLSQSLWLYDVQANEGMPLLMLPMKEKRFLSGDTRCDFHPRWNRDGTRICFDAVDPATGTRQLHLVELEF